MKLCGESLCTDVACASYRARGRDVMSACGRPVDVALSTCDPLDVTCRVCQRSPAVRDVPVPFVVTEKGRP